MLAKFFTAAAVAATLVAAVPCSNLRIHPNGNSDFCLSVPSTNVVGATATVEPCDGSAGQNWYFEYSPYTTAVHLRNVGDTSGLCLSAEVYRVKPAAEGNQLAMQGCFNDGATDWGYTTNGNIIMGYNMNPETAGMCMDLDAGNLSGGKVQIWTCYAGNPNQVWTLS